MAKAFTEAGKSTTEVVENKLGHKVNKPAFRELEFVQTFRLRDEFAEYFAKIQVYLTAQGVRGKAGRGYADSASATDVLNFALELVANQIEGGE